MASSIGNSSEAIFRGMIHDQNAKRWQELESRLQQAVVIDGEALPRSRFRDYLLNDLAGDGDAKEVRIDAMLVDADTPGIAARLIHRVTPAASPSKPFEYQEIVFAIFADGLLSAWQTVRDEDGFRNRDPAAPSLPSSSSFSSSSFNRRPSSPSSSSFSSSSFNRRPSSPASSAGLKSFYRSYVKSINDRTMSQEFDSFCRPVLRHNDRELTVAEYIPLISDSQDAIDGLRFDILDLFADGETQQIAARLEFTGVPVEEWGGARPNGASVRFHEHVMYQLEEGKISRVWSTIELDAYRRQMGKDVS